ncbi:MAG TPA: 30S ribosomal protein S2 [bacterium]|nr:30S ribosomal protein S2 [bacterium]HPL95336.1 30S ribosomal protein S2 [bacterium]
MTIPTEKELMRAGAHFGHKPASWHPKMADFIYGQKNNVHIINLTKTKEQLTLALNIIKETAAHGEQILLVGTKIQARDIIKKYALDSNMPYIIERWLGGTLTNFKVINGLVKKLEKLEQQEAANDYEEKYTKKERQEFSLTMEKLRFLIAGIKNMQKLPALIFVASAREEKTALQEALKMKISTIAICDTNADPSNIDYPIPANDDASKTLELIIGLVAEAIKDGQKELLSTANSTN